MENISLKQLMLAACSLMCALSVAPVKTGETLGRYQVAGLQKIRRELFPLTDTEKFIEDFSCNEEMPLDSEVRMTAEELAARVRTTLQAAHYGIAQSEQQNRANTSAVEVRFAIVQNQAE